MDVPLTAFAFASAALAASLVQRWRLRKKDGNDTARYVEAERIVSMLSARQPGVWDQEDLRERVQAVARDVWSLPTRDALAQLHSWVNPSILDQVAGAWRGDRRELDVRFTAPVSFVQVNEGGPGPDRLIARVSARWDGSWLDAKGQAVKKERKGPHTTYHTWVHIDGQGWQLDAIADKPPTSEPPPSSVSCRILPQTAVEQREPNL